MVLTSKSFSESQGSNLENLNKSGILAIIGYDSLNQMIGHGTGFALYDYDSDTLRYILSAKHVFDPSTEIDLLLGNYDSGFVSILNNKIPLKDSLGNNLYFTFSTNSIDTIDLALLPVSGRFQKKGSPTLICLSRSSCIYSDSVYVGDHLLAFGFASPKIFDFVIEGRPLATSGIIAFKTEQSYLMDKKTHPGMSGGIVFKEIYTPSGVEYQAVGIVSAVMSKYKNYSWITKLDYIDSIFIQINGKGWGK